MPYLHDEHPSARRRTVKDSPAHRVVVIGGGFGGLQAVRALRGEPVQITLIDRRNFHLFQPLLYQVATGVLAPMEIAAPLRRVFARDPNVRVVLAEVTGFDLENRLVLARAPTDSEHQAFEYDSVIVAGGSEYSYFGHDGWRPFAPDVKSLESALDVQRRMSSAFEAAEIETDAERRAAWLTFVIVGAGPTGVELAGQIAELAHRRLRHEFRAFDTSATRILLVEQAERVLPGLDARLSASAAQALHDLGVTPWPGRRVVGIDVDSVTVEAASGAAERVPARTTVWAAGIAASDLAAALAVAAGVERDHLGRVPVGPGLTLAGHPGVMAIGDMAAVHDAAGRPIPLPALAPVAMQQGRYAARRVREGLRGRATRPFRYRDKGNLATIGRAKAVADVHHLQLTGLPAWVTWLAVHLFYLIGFQNRAVVLIRWIFAFFTRRGGGQLITGADAPRPRP
jgi:NADH dehydrogenase